MKNRMKKIALTLIILAGICTFFNSCYTPSPLYGNWADNDGNKISFINDGAFVATVLNSIDKKVVYEGEYTVIDNVVVFTTKNGLKINSEWDIRGSMLYLTWTSDGVTKKLVLYHISK